ncbi:hypothetical protein CTI14_45515 [Methylobacterium radiotolerans]|nr:hypothetical protein CTI14_45515 [Methylobacterium radiotolerans]
MTTLEMPRWRTDDLYAGLDDTTFTADLSAIQTGVTDLETLFDDLDIRQGAPRDARNDGSQPHAPPAELPLSRRSG